ncbi:hypothetical protein V1477_006041 [Vespula maculifrons]|uniref:Uncharacterized protein n=1 Tax=Vespula maculifrons TaxID=7453 RepID=A0ABD2CKL4_VESMC
MYGIFMSQTTPRRHVVVLNNKSLLSCRQEVASVNRLARGIVLYTCKAHGKNNEHYVFVYTHIFVTDDDNNDGDDDNDDDDDSDDDDDDDLRRRRISMKIIKLQA